MSEKFDADGIELIISSLKSIHNLFNAYVSQFDFIGFLYFRKTLLLYRTFMKYVHLNSFAYLF